MGVGSLPNHHVAAGISCNEEFQVNTLHIYSPMIWHDDAFIVGDTASLLELRAAIDMAFATGCGTFLATVSDGEGFDMFVVREDDEAVLNDLQFPYTDEIACGGRDTRKWPAKHPAATEAYAGVQKLRGTN